MAEQDRTDYESLKPTTPETRFFEPWSYCFMWISSVVIIAWWLMGVNAVPPVGPLNWQQAVVAAIVAHVIMALGVSLMGHAGVVHGIPYPIQSRTAFGYIGAKIPNIIRATPAICWFGIESWLGAMAFHGGIKIVTGIDFGFSGTLVIFLIFQAVQTVLTMRGIKLLKTVVSYIAVYLLPMWIIIAYRIYREVGFGAAEVWAFPGTWGLPFWFIVTAFMGILTTGMLNASDYCRYYPERQVKSNYLMTFLGIVPTGVALVVIGLLAGAGTGMYDPVEVMIQKFPEMGWLIPLLIFVAFAQWGTNISLNIVPPANVIMEMTDKIGWKGAVIITGVLGTLTFPWWLMSAQIFMWYMVVYSAFLGPIYGIMICDYYVIWKKRPHIDKLYDLEHPDIKYDNGWNWAGIIALLIGSASSFIVPGISWFIGAPVGALAYYILVKTWYQKRHPNIGEIEAA